MFPTLPGSVSRPWRASRMCIAAWLVVSLFTPTLPAQERGKTAAKDDTAVPAKLTKERFFEKVIEARGGREALEAVRNRVSKGTIEVKSGQASQSSSMEIWEAEGDKRYQTFQFGPSPIERGSDGTTIWEIVQGTARLLAGEEKDNAARMNRFNDVLHWSEIYPDTQIVGKESVDDQSCYKVVQRPAAGPERTLYFSRKTGLLVRLDTVRQTPQASLPVVIRYEDYRDVNGVKLPFRTVQRVQAGDQEQIVTTVWKTIEQNLEGIDDRFALPEAVQKLVEAAPGGDAAKDSK